MLLPLDFLPISEKRPGPLEDIVVSLMKAKMKKKKKKKEGFM